MGPDIFSVSAYLGLINEVISSRDVRVRGEIGQVTTRGTVMYFSIRDENEPAVLNCFMWISDYKLAGVKIEEGLEVILSGRGEVYKPTGRLSLRVSTIELVGEGELKKAYAKLKAKLEVEGLFNEKGKRALPLFPKRIGLITSREGAVIHDYLNNLGRYGFVTTFINSRVEGARASREILKAMRYFKGKEIDALVVIRGGGSFESFIAFNNEMIVREIRALPFPVIAGIGHDQDVPLFSLGADIMTSTPTAVTALLNSSWKEATSSIDLYEHDLLSRLREIKVEAKGEIEELTRRIREAFKNKLDDIASFLKSAEQIFRHNDPKRQLKFGYSISRIDGKIVRSVTDVKKDQTVITEVSDGNYESVVL